jgi:hypothetical protein
MSIVTRVALGLLMGLCLSGCMRAHQVQLGEVDAQAVERGQHFEILISETGVNLDEAAEVVKVFAGSRAEEVDQAQDIVEMFQMGPKTGNPVYDEGYADALFEALRAECPRGQISGLMSVRETAQYPVVSGEIVKVTGYCLEER